MLVTTRLSQERTLILTFPYCFELRVYRYPVDSAPTLPHQAARQSVNGYLTPEHCSTTYTYATVLTDES